MSKAKLKELLTQRLKLRDPIFRLERIGKKLAGSIITPSFRGKGDWQRVQMIWKTLDKELGAKAVLEVGTLLTYTPEEWNVDLPAAVG